jgi:hypothetical protein
MTERELAGIACAALDVECKMESTSITASSTMSSTRLRYARKVKRWRCWFIWEARRENGTEVGCDIRSSGG